MFSHETIAKVTEFSRSAAVRALPENIRRERIQNYRRSLELDMTNNKRPIIPGARREAVRAGKVPEVVTPNPKAAKRLEARLRAFEGMSAIQQASHTRPGSLSK